MSNPPFSITTTILSLVTEISYLLGELDGQSLDIPEVSLRKANSIRTIQASLAIEGNTLSLDQVSAILDGVKVIGPEQDILEVNNAISVYGKIFSYKYNQQVDFKRAHKIMMSKLIPDAGNYRAGNVGVFAGSRVAHVAPPAKRVPRLMDDLFAFLKKEKEVSLLLKACIFHYEVEFIHPFADGNGRIGRLWQQVILSGYHNVFRYVPIESLIKQKQSEYYKVLAKCDQNGDSTLFIEFSLELVLWSLQEYFENLVYQPKTSLDRLNFAKRKFDKIFTRKDYCRALKSISTATASRDLKYGVENKILLKTGDKRTAFYKFVTP